MQAKILQITEKVNSFETDIASIDHFRTKPGPVVDAQATLNHPAVSLYCLDDIRREAVFVETSPGVNLLDQPFYFQAQYQRAERLITLSYETLHQLADLAGDGFENLIFIYSVGRCGSTLLSRTLNRITTVYSLGEPDVHTQIAALRPRDGTRDGELTRLLRSCTRVLYKPQLPATTALAVKFRAYGIEIADLLYKALETGSADLVIGFATDWQIQSLNLVVLDDDREYFPNYHGAPLVREDFLKRHPEVADVLNRLAGRIGDEAMRRLNYQVAVEHRIETEVAREFLRKQGLVE